MKIISLILLLFLFGCKGSGDEATAFHAKEIDLINALSGTIGSNVIVELNGEPFEFGKGTYDGLRDQAVDSRGIQDIKIDVLDASNNTILASETYGVTKSSSTTDLKYSIIVGGNAGDVRILLLDENKNSELDSSKPFLRIVFMNTKSTVDYDVYLDSNSPCDTSGGTPVLATDSAPYHSGFMEVPVDATVCFTERFSNTIVNLSSVTIGAGDRKNLLVLDNFDFSVHE